MKERYINNKIDTINKEMEEVTGTKESIHILTGLGSVALGTFALISVSAFPAFAIASSLGLGGCLLGMYRNKKMNDASIKRLENEKNHLNKIKDNTPKKSSDLNKKRVKKIKALEALGRQMSDSYDTISKFNGITNVAIGAGIIGTFINPAFAYVGLGGLALNAISSKVLITKKQERENILNRRNNIKNDIETIINEDRDQQAQRLKTRHGVVTDKVNLNTKQKTNSEKNEKIADMFIKNLANKKEEEKQKQKVKK